MTATLPDTQMGSLPSQRFSTRHIGPQVHDREKMLAALGLTDLDQLVEQSLPRTIRSTELRFMGFRFVDEQSRFLWESMKHLEFPVLVPHRPGGRGLVTSSSAPSARDWPSG